MRQSNLASCISQVIVFYTRTLVFYFNTDITEIILYLILIWRCQEEKKKGGGVGRGGVVVVVVVSFGVLF